jgi:hypothetical protein
VYAEPIVSDVEGAALVAAIDAKGIVTETVSVLPCVCFGSVLHLVRTVSFCQASHAAHSIAHSSRTRSPERYFAS